MTTMTQRVEGIKAQSREIKFLPTMQLWIAGIAFGSAWVVGKVFKVLWASLTFIWIACVLGFKSGVGKGG